MIRRIFNFLLLALMIVGAGVTYDMKHKAEVAAERVAKLEADIARERDSIALLRAEWAMLTQPGRLQDVIEKYNAYFKLEPFSPKQLASIDDIPLKPVPPPNPITEELAKMGIDATTTGGIQ
jgi:hypothetical protein